MSSQSAGPRSAARSIDTGFSDMRASAKPGGLSLGGLPASSIWDGSIRFVLMRRARSAAASRSLGVVIRDLSPILVPRTCSSSGSVSSKFPGRGGLGRARRRDGSPASRPRTRAPGAEHKRLVGWKPGDNREERPGARDVPRAPHRPFRWRKRDRRPTTEIDKSCFALQPEERESSQPSRVAEGDATVALIWRRYAGDRFGATDRTQA